MAGMNQLPDEVLLLIVETVAAAQAETYQDVLSLLKVNHKFYSLVLPRLYRSLHLGSWLRKPRKLCASLILNDRLAGFVQRIRTHRNFSIAFEDVHELTAKFHFTRNDHLDETTLDRLKSRLAKIFRDREDKYEQWLDEMDQQRIRYLIPLALVHLPNLQSLDMIHLPTFDLWEELAVLEDQLQNDVQLDRNKKPFTKIRHVSIEGLNWTMRKIDFYEGGIDQSLIPLAIVTKWPAVEMIQAGHVAEPRGCDASVYFKQLQPGSLNLSRLDLSPFSHIGAKNLRLLLSTSRRLQEFKYLIDHPRYSTDRMLTTSDIESALNLHKESIERLTLLCVPLQWATGTGSQGEQLRFGDYTRLQHVCIGAPLLFCNGPVVQCPSADPLCQLPPSLVSLGIMQITSAGEARATRDMVREMLWQRESFPCWNSLELNCLWPHARQDGDVMLFDPTLDEFAFRKHMKTMLDDTELAVRFTRSRWDFEKGLRILDENLYWQELVSESDEEDSSEIDDNSQFQEGLVEFEVPQHADDAV